MSAPGPAPAAGRYIGQSVPRREDARLLTGRGRYVSDIVVPAMLHVAFVRSDLARARIERLDVTAARSAPGVHAVLTAADLNHRVQGDLHATLSVGAGAPLVPLADAEVRYVGQPIAIVVAEDRYLAEDAAELVEIDYQALPAVVDPELAIADDVNLVHAELGTNVAGTMSVPADEQLQQILANAPHVVRETIVQQRQTQVPMEGRALVASWDPSRPLFEIDISSQAPHEVRSTASRITGVPSSNVRVRTGDVGGGFGQKSAMTVDEGAVLLAAHLLARPLKWVEDRHENLMSALHARADRVDVTLALDEDGHILGGSIDHLEDGGAMSTFGPFGTGTMVAAFFTGPYRWPKFAWTTTTAYTNTCSRGPYRGPWQVETLARERMMDIAARQIGIDPLELRRRNVLQPADLPYPTHTGIVLNHISPAQSIDEVAQLIGYDAFREEQARAFADGRLLGIGLGAYVEPNTSFGPYATEGVVVRMQPDGTIDAYVGSGAHGQGLETTTAQIVAEHVGVDVDAVRVHQGDTEGTPFSPGTGGSHSGPVMGAAVREGSQALRAKVLGIAAHLLEADPDDLEVVGGQVTVRGVPAATVSVSDVATTAHWNSTALPDEVDIDLAVSSRYRAPDTLLSNACHAAVCEVDPETGVVTLLRYAVTEDCGVLINPKIVEGQIAGGATQGIGGALYEEMVYDSEGNPLTTTFLDYLIPTATEVPDFRYGHIENPAPTPGGHKGAGEGGAIGAPPAVLNAVADALALVGASLPPGVARPDRVLAAIEAAAQRVTR